jgi:hypothetical protein
VQISGIGIIDILPQAVSARLQPRHFRLLSPILMLVLKQPLAQQGLVHKSQRSEVQGTGKPKAQLSAIPFEAALFEKKWQPAALACQYL